MANFCRNTSAPVVDPAMDETSPAVVISAEAIIESTHRGYDISITAFLVNISSVKLPGVVIQDHQFRQHVLPSYRMTALEGETSKELMTVILI